MNENYRIEQFDTVKFFLLFLLSWDLSQRENAPTLKLC